MIVNHKVEEAKSKIIDLVTPSNKGKVNDLLKELTKEIVNSHFNESKHLLEILHLKAIRDL